MLLVVPEVPTQPSAKPLVQGFGCRLGGDTLSCEVLYIGSSIPTQTLTAQLHTRGREPIRLALAWSDIPPGLYRNAAVDLVKES